MIKKYDIKDDGTDGGKAVVDEQERSIGFAVPMISRTEFIKMASEASSTNLSLVATYSALSSVGLSLSRLMLMAQLTQSGHVKRKARDVGLFQFLTETVTALQKQVQQLRPTKLQTASLVGDGPVCSSIAAMDDFITTHAKHESPMSLKTALSVAQNACRMIGTTLRNQSRVKDSVTLSVAAASQQYWKVWQTMVELKLPVPPLSTCVPSQLFYGTFALPLPTKVLRCLIFAARTADRVPGHEHVRYHDFLYRVADWKPLEPQQIKTKKKKGVCRASKRGVKNVWYLSPPVVPGASISSQIYGGFMTPREHLACLKTVREHTMFEFIGSTAALAVELECGAVQLFTWNTSLQLFVPEDLKVRKTVSGTYRFATSLDVDAACAEIAQLFHDHWWDMWWDVSNLSQLKFDEASARRLADMTQTKREGIQTVLTTGTKRAGGKQRRNAAEMKALLAQLRPTT